MSDSRGGCQLAAVPWSTSRLADVRVTGLRTSLFRLCLRAAKAAVGEYTADTGPPGDRPCPAGPRAGLLRRARAGAARGLLFAFWAASSARTCCDSLSLPGC